MKNKIFLFAGLLIVALFVFVSCGGDDDDTGVGTVRVSLTDAPGEVESLLVAISDVSIHYVPQGQDGEASEEEYAADDQAADDKDTEESNDGYIPDKPAWISMLEEETTIDLIQLKDNPKLLGLYDLTVGKITQIRLYVSETTAPVAVIDGEEYELTVPSGKIKLTSKFDIVADEELHIMLDFDAEESIVETGSGKYQLKPTIKVIEVTEEAGEGEGEGELEN